MTETVRFDYRKLRGKIVEVYGSTASFCKSIGKNRSAVSNKLKNGQSMRQEDIILYAHALGIPESDYSDYFFTAKV